MHCKYFAPIYVSITIYPLTRSIAGCSRPARGLRNWRSWCLTASLARSASRIKVSPSQKKNFFFAFICFWCIPSFLFSTNLASGWYNVSLAIKFASSGWATRLAIASERLICRFKWSGASIISSFSLVAIWRHFNISTVWKWYMYVYNTHAKQIESRSMSLSLSPSLSLGFLSIQINCNLAIITDKLKKTGKNMTAKGGDRMSALCDDEALIVKCLNSSNRWRKSSLCRPDTSCRIKPSASSATVWASIPGLSAGIQFRKNIG